MRVVMNRVKDSQMPSLLFLLFFPCLLLAQVDSKPIPGAERPGAYLPLLHGKAVALVANQTSRVGEQHLVDFLLERQVNLRRVFAPEHGFRGTASAGSLIEDGRDSRTGLAVISLYGANKKPQAEHLEDLDLVVFDIQDVGARFYTYISTLSYLMEACARAGVKVLVLDRPNPHGHYVDGPVLEPAYQSFVGLHPVPVVHGMTVGEYARMVNGEGWLPDGLICPLEVITCANYTHQSRYDLPVKPSPNLPNALAVALYPSLCFFEGTPVSVGRGTDLPFQQIGAPWFEVSNTTFRPQSLPGAQNPPFEGQWCKGFDLREFARLYLRESDEIYLYWLTEAYAISPQPEKFFRPFFDKLAGTARLREMIEAGATVAEIRASWQADLSRYKLMRKKYLLYPL